MKNFKITKFQLLKPAKSFGKQNNTNFSALRPELLTFIVKKRFELLM